MPEVEKIRSLNFLNPQGPGQVCSGKTLPSPYVPSAACSVLVFIHEHESTCIFFINKCSPHLHPQSTVILLILHIGLPNSFLVYLFYHYIYVYIYIYTYTADHIKFHLRCLSHSLEMFCQTPILIPIHEYWYNYNLTFFTVYFIHIYVELLHIYNTSFVHYDTCRYLYSKHQVSKS